MDKLITATDIATLYPISANINEQKAIDPFIIQAQEFDLKPFLGDPFFLALYADFPDLNVYSDLWNGCTYEWGGYNYVHAGLNSYLISCAYARYLVKANSTATPFGIVQKETPYSSPTDPKILAMNIQQVKSASVGYLAQVEDFLFRKANDYPLFRMNLSKGKRKTSISISSIKKMR
jgi:hypothetical protein